MTTRILNLSQFLFPIFSVLLLVTGLAGPYTIQLSIVSLLVGFFYSIGLIFMKKSMIPALINLTAILFVFVGGLVLFFIMINSGV
ncbi:hypothetical protein [Thalassobacillus hwangdonensis]|uniref:Uncharacterized protein n=1 Tax=Thalassobacillus hwangdonensis TaxID=546108 RepID=A0ABW3L2W2_9BACI